MTAAPDVRVGNARSVPRDRVVRDADTVGVKELLRGSDVEIANRVLEDLTARHGRIVHTEGAFWRSIGTHWEAIPEEPDLRRVVHCYDGAVYETAGGRSSWVRLDKGRINSVLNEAGAISAAPDFFTTGPDGINCASGFIRFAGDGTPRLEPHSPDHRCRQTLPGRWRPGASGKPPEGSLLQRLLTGVFRGEADANEKAALLAEVAGAAALGYAIKLLQPRAVILLGQTAENGKSQILDLVRGLLPASAISSVPAARMGDERHIVGLVGKLLNATDELSSKAIASNTFKSVVTGEPVEGRDVYKSRIEFRAKAQQLFATNELPSFKGGFDRGVRRRLLVIPFNRTIPANERIENIGQRIAEEEADLLLAWAVDGAAGLVRQRGFTMPPSSKTALNEWILGADPVLAWLDECTETRPIRDGEPSIKRSFAYEQFRNWATAEGYRADTLPGNDRFKQRVEANADGVVAKRTSAGRFFQGLVITQYTPSPSVK